jgi:hypothetical protein
MADVQRGNMPSNGAGSHPKVARQELVRESQEFGFKPEGNKKSLQDFR